MARSVSARALGPPGQLKFGIWSPSRMHPPRRSPYSAPMADAGRQGLRYAWYLASAAAWFSSVGLQQVMTPWLAALPALALGFAIAGGRLSLAVVLACATAAGSLNAFSNPARDSLLSQVA